MPVLTTCTYIPVLYIHTYVYPGASATHNYSTLDEASVFHSCNACVSGTSKHLCCSSCGACEYSQKRLLGGRGLEHICYQSTCFTCNWQHILSYILYMCVCIIYFTSVEEACKLWLFPIPGCFVIRAGLGGISWICLLYYLWSHSNDHSWHSLSALCTVCVTLFKSPYESSYMQACYLYTSLYTILSVTAIIPTPWLSPNCLSSYIMHTCVLIHVRDLDYPSSQLSEWSHVHACRGMHVQANTCTHKQACILASM